MKDEKIEVVQTFSLQEKDLAIFCVEMLQKEEKINERFLLFKTKTSYEVKRIEKIIKPIFEPGQWKTDSRWTDRSRAYFARAMEMNIPNIALQKYFSISQASAQSYKQKIIGPKIKEYLKTYYEKFHSKEFEDQIKQIESQLKEDKKYELNIRDKAILFGLIDLKVGIKHILPLLSKKTIRDEDCKKVCMQILTADRDQHLEYFKRELEKNETFKHKIDKVLLKNNGNWTEKELASLMRKIEHEGKNFATVAEELKRGFYVVLDKYKEICRLPKVKHELLTKRIRAKD